MLKFLAGEGLQPKFAKRLKYMVAIFGSCCLGYLSGKNEWERKKDWCNTNSLTEYQCEDQINNIIQTTHKPAVIYYYLPMQHTHHIFRAFMLKYSNKYPNNANWVMCNLKQNFQLAKQALRTIVYPISYSRIEIRFPKGQIMIFQDDGSGNVKLIKQLNNSNRRQVYGYDHVQSQFRSFLQEHSVIEGEDPMIPVLKITQKALFKEL